MTLSVYPGVDILDMGKYSYHIVIQSGKLELFWIAANCSVFTFSYKLKKSRHSQLSLVTIRSECF